MLTPRRIFLGRRSGQKLAEEAGHSSCGRRMGASERERGERGGFHFISPRSINLRRNAFRHPSCPRSDGRTDSSQAGCSHRGDDADDDGSKNAMPPPLPLPPPRAWAALSPGHRRPTCALLPPVNCLSRTQFVLMRRTKEEGPRVARSKWLPPPLLPRIRTTEISSLI